MCQIEKYKSIYFISFQYTKESGENVKPKFLVVFEYNSKNLKQYNENDLNNLIEHPFNDYETSIFLMAYAYNDVSCFLELGWSIPHYIIDVYSEWRVFTNSNITNSSDTIWDRESKSIDLNYYFGATSSILSKDCNIECEKYFIMSEKSCKIVEKVMYFYEFYKNKLILNQALFRGEYIVCLSEIERRGIPIDSNTLIRLREKWETIKLSFIEEVDINLKVYQGDKFNTKKFGLFLNSKNIEWPKYKNGSLLLDDDTFKEMSLKYPDIKPIRDLRKTLSVMKNFKLSVGVDSRNRTCLRPFISKTGRNQPSNSSFIFGLPCWMRGLIKPKKGKSLCYIDWSQQEFGIAAALSHDENMIKAYESGDPYMEFAIQAGAAPKDATKKSHGNIREQYKTCAIAVQYCMGARSLASRLISTIDVAKNLLNIHKRTYPDYWKWSDKIVDYAFHMRKLKTKFGWGLHILNVSDRSKNSLRNFPMQANGSDMLRLACVMMKRKGVSVIATVHDAVLIEANTDCIEANRDEAMAIMGNTSRELLGTLTLRADSKIIYEGDRYMDERGRNMWGLMMRKIEGDGDS
ncbi:DNA polymerase [Solidesulfovibrio sp. C21]|uniref:DNA polymerase n=1 Tax=Solidesulfovibrio sp. C21 TaxID=3398613 RepID=UPI0039FD5C8C